MEKQVEFNLNGKSVRLAYDGSRMLLWALRVDFNLTGTKYGCGEGHCGSCAVLVNGEAVRSCQTAVSEVAEKKVTTIEGLAQGDKLHPVQKAFMEHDALQCGFCTPGMIMTAVELLSKKPHPSRAEIIRGMEGNLCRCGAHTRIIDAIESAAKASKPNEGAL